MAHSTTLFLRLVLLLIAAGALVFLIWQPLAESANANSGLAAVYLDPFVLYVYLGSLAFFFGLFQTFKLLGFAGRGEAVSPAGVAALRRIKCSALVVIAFIIGAEAFIFFGADEDGAGAVALGVMMSFVCVVTAAAAALLQRVLQSAVDQKLENDLTV
jgi:Flp pilus assembly pilin Flp